MSFIYPINEIVSNCFASKYESMRITRTESKHHFNRTLTHLYTIIPFINITTEMNEFFSVSFEAFK